jgi:flagellar protein FlbT
MWMARRTRAAGHMAATFDREVHVKQILPLCSCLQPAKRLVSRDFCCYRLTSPLIDRRHSQNRKKHMSLKVELKPGERLIIGQCIITNSDQRTRLFIDGKAPILREKDILTVKTADTPAKRIYLAVQLMYLEDDTARLREEYFRLVNEIIAAAPSMISLINGINNEILTDELYKALKAARKLIQYEQDLLANVSSGSAGIPTGGPQDGSPA